MVDALYPIHQQNLERIRLLSKPGTQKLAFRTCRLYVTLPVSPGRYAYDGDEAFGFSLVKATCLDNHAHTHEFGRNLGCRDDRERTEVDTDRGHGICYCDGPFP